MTGIQNFRLKKGLTQEELANIVKVDRSSVAKWETGKSAPRASLLPKVADALGCTVDELLRETA